MKKMKKLFAVILSLAMVLGMCTVASAEPETPNYMNRATISVSNVEDGATVTAYQLTKATYTANGFAGYMFTDDALKKIISDLTAPTSDQITQIAGDKELLTRLAGVSATPFDISKKATEQTGTATGEKYVVNLTQTGNGSAYSASVPAGYWLVLVTKANSAKVYNPMLLGAYYRTVDENNKPLNGNNTTMENGAISATDSWKLLPTENAYAKSGEPEIVKEIVNSGSNLKKDDPNAGDVESKKGNDVAVGDTVEFKVTTDIPSYSDEYTKVEYRITDNLDGLDNVRDVQIYEATVNEKKEVVLGIPVPEDKYTLTINEDKTSYVIDFNKDTEDDKVSTNYIKGFASTTATNKFVVTYKATLIDSTRVNYDPHTNTVKLTYTNKPEVNDDGTTPTNDKEDKTYHYTFGIDADLYGKNDGYLNDRTEELVKTGISHVEIIEGEKHETIRLSGAEFTLTRTDKKVDENGKPYVYTTESNELGHLTFVGLDAGTYELTETKAPDGYSINDAKIPVVITADYNDDGTLNSYSITVNGEKTSTYTATYQADEPLEVDSTVSATVDKYFAMKDENGNLIKIDEKTYQSMSNTFEIKNTQLSALPSTGGIGTTIFTIGGCVIMIAAAALFFASRKKSQK